MSLHPFDFPKRSLLVLILALPMTAGAGDLPFETHILSNNLVFLLSVDAADLDGDGDLDILAAARDSDAFAWFEQGGIDCAPDPWCEHILSNTAGGAASIRAADLNADGRIDVVGAASGAGGGIFWYENTPTAFEEHLIDDSTEKPLSVTVADLDGDGDLDVLAGYQEANKVFWFESSGGPNPTFELQIIDDDNGAIEVQTGDLDLDGDLDVLTASLSEWRVTWYENRMPLAFEQHDITTDFAKAISVAATDVDQDGLVDIVASCRGEAGGGANSRIAWFRQTGLDKPAWTEQVIIHENEGVMSNAKGIYLADMNADGLLDIVSSSAGNMQAAPKIMWHERIAGDPPSFLHHIIAMRPEVTRCRAVHAVDIDADGDLDVVSASQDGSNHLALHENHGVVVVEARSRRLHGAIEMDIDLLESGGIEPRQGGFDRLLFSTDLPLNPATATCRNVQFTCSDMAPACQSVELLEDETTIMVTLVASPPDGSCCDVTFAGLESAEGLIVSSPIQVLRLEGDINFDRAVTGGDAAAIKPHLGEIAGVDLQAGQFDFDVSGGVTGGDLALIKPLLGNLASDCP